VDRVFGSTIMVAPRDGSAKSMSVSAEGFSPIWSPDGRWIAFFEKTVEGIGIFRVGPDGAEKVRLAAGTIVPPGYTATPHMKIGVNHIAWAPRSDLLAYTATLEGFSNIWTVGADGSGLKDLTSNRDTNEKLCCPAWTSDGKYLVYSSSSWSQSQRKISRLWLYRVTDGETKAIFESAATFRFLGFGEGGAALLAQASADVTSAVTPQSLNVISLSLADHSAKKISTIDNAYIHNVHLSRDGRTIAFVSKRDDQTALWTVPVNGGTPKRILTENDPKILISSLAWAPDGSSIIFGKETRTNLLSMLAK
jgi:Tol biopolymer transport system component